MKKTRQGLTERIFRRIFIVIIIIFAGLSLNEGKLITVKGDKRVEHLDNMQDGYLMIYNHDLVTNSGKELTTTSEMNCRWAQIATKSTFGSLQKLSEGNFSCKLSSEALHEVSFISKAGSYIFYRTNRKKFFPAKDGLFYSYWLPSNIVLTFKELKNICHLPPKKFIPFARSAQQQEILKQIAKDTKDQKVFVAAECRRNEDKPKWLDSQTFNQLQFSCEGSEHVSFTEDGEFEIEYRGRTLSFLCVYDPFELGWD